MNSTNEIIQAVTKASYNKKAIAEAIKSFLGQPGENASVLYGQVPTDKLEVEVNENGKITTIRWYSGLKWTAKNGYGTPSVEVTL